MNMTKRVVAALLFAFALTSAPAMAGELFATLSGKLFGAAYNAATSGVVAIVKSTTTDVPQEWTAREPVDIESLADQMLQDYPEDQRALMRPPLIAKLKQAQARSNEPAQQVETVRMDQQVTTAVIGSAVPQVVANRAVFDAAERAAYSRQRIGGAVNVHSAANMGSFVANLGRMLMRGSASPTQTEKSQGPVANSAAQPE
jgi:hypothetical protein